MDQETTANYVILTILFGSLVIGLLSMLIGRVVALYDWLSAWLQNGYEQQRYNNMSSRSIVTPPRSMPVSVPDTDTDTSTMSFDTSFLAANLTESQRVEIMALAQNDKGKWAHSGNKLFTLFGGNRNEFTATMRRLRGEQADDLSDEPMRITPIAGRATRAAFFESDPELIYHPPK